MVGVAIGEEMVTVGDVLSAAADRIEKYGWKRGNYGTTFGPVCAWGAINMATTGRPGGVVSSQAENMLSKFINPPSGLVDWNDNIAESKRQVVKTLRLAAWVYDDTLLPNPVVRRG